MRRLRGNDRGVAAVIVGISVLMVFAFLGFAVDAGAIYQERRELRNGADAGALAVAEDCVTGAKACSDAVGTGTAETYADLNADDGRSGVDSVEIDPVPANPDYDLTVRVVTSSEDGAGNAGLDGDWSDKSLSMYLSVIAGAGSDFSDPLEWDGSPIVINKGDAVPTNGATGTVTVASGAEVQGAFEIEVDDGATGTTGILRYTAKATAVP